MPDRDFLLGVTKNQEEEKEDLFPAGTQNSIFSLPSLLDQWKFLFGGIHERGHFQSPFILFQKTVLLQIQSAQALPLLQHQTSSSRYGA